MDGAPGADLDAAVAELFPEGRVICSTVPEIVGAKRLQDIKAPAELDDVEVGIVRPAFAVAETGSIWLSEVELGAIALAHLAPHLVALLDPADILPNLHHAEKRPEFLTANSAVLIRGAQGIRSLMLIPAPR